MQVWNMLHAAHWKYRTQKIAKNSPSVHHRTTSSGYVFTTKARVDNQKKNLLSSNVSPRCLHNMVNIGPLATEICWRVWGSPANFNGFRFLAALLQRRHSPEANQTLHYVWPLPELVDNVYIFGGCCPVMEFCHVRAKFTLRPPSLALCSWQRYCTPLEQWARAKLCGIKHRTPPRAYIQQGDHHVGHWPTF